MAKKPDLPTLPNGTSSVPQAGTNQQSSAYWNQNTGTPNAYGDTPTSTVPSNPAGNDGTTDTTGGNNNPVNPSANPSALPETPVAAETPVATETPVQQTPVEQTPATVQPIVTATMPNIDANAMVEQQKQSIPNVNAAVTNQQGLLNQWQNTAVQQRNAQIDYATQQGINELNRTLADAQSQYKEQQESIAKDEAQAKDNAALYAEARGDKGGIGAEQYNSIMNTAAQNRLAVQQAQTKLATDTQRQIADLRAQGEFDKADAALEISQQYLSQLISLEQWAFDAGMTVAQFRASLDEWLADYQMTMAQYQTEVDMWNADYNFNQTKFDYEKTQNTNNQLISTGEALLSAGVMPSASQLAAMKMSTEQAKAYIEAAKLSAQSGSNYTTDNGTISVKDMNDTQLYQYLYDRGFTSETSETEMKNALTTAGISSSVAQDIVAEFIESKYASLKAGYEEQQNAKYVAAAEAIPENVRITLQSAWESTNGYVTSPAIWNAMVDQHGEDGIRGLGLKPVDEIEPSSGAVSVHKALSNLVRNNTEYSQEALINNLELLSQKKGNGITDTDIMWLLYQFGLI